MRIRLPLALLTATFACSLTAATAVAAPRDRVFVASYGTDSGNTTCSFTQPCRTFANAIANVAVGGEVTAIDSAGFGPVTITQSVTITSPNGVEAGIVNPGGNAVTINPTTAAVVTLRGLTLEGSGSGQNGIVYSPTAGGNGTAVLNIIGCVVKDFTADGISLVPNSAQYTSVHIDDSAILNNAGNGIELNPQSTSTGISFTIDRTVVKGNAPTASGPAGILINSGTSAFIQGTISSSHVAGNGIGLHLIGTAADTTVRVRDSVFTLDLYADVASSNGGTAFLLLYTNQIDFLTNTAGTVYSDGNNNIGFLTGNALISSPRQ
jgi:hypothetical protein